MKGCTQASGACTHYGNLFVFLRLSNVYLEAVGKTVIANEAFDRVDRHGFVVVFSITLLLTGVEADSAHDCREGIFLRDQFPGLFKPPLAGQIHISGNILASRALLVTRRNAINKQGFGKLPASGFVYQAGGGRDGA
ncbi:hypothetical protein ES703_79648 [subsurface metagenome]